MKRPFSPIFALVSLGAFLTAPAGARTWTDTQGRTLEATLVESTATEVTLRLDATGKNATLPLSRLSNADAEFVSKSKKDAPKPGGVSAAAAPAGDLNFDAPWPQSIRLDENPEIATVTEDKVGKRFVYESTNYRFICNVGLSQSVVKGFAVMFESTYNYCRALPLSISGGKKTDGKYLILLFETKDQYIEAGGPPSSAGVYMPGKNTVMVPLTSLGVRQMGSNYMLDRDKTSGTLIHELTHQLTPEPYYSTGAMGWFSEGLSEYTTATPYRSGLFKVKSNLDDIIAYATEYGKQSNGGRALGNKIDAPALKDFMLQSYSSFTGVNGNFNYGFSLMLTTYFLHMDGAGDAARVKKFLEALRAGKHGQAAIDVLLDGRSYEELEEAVAKAWKHKRVEINFRKSRGGSSGDDA